MMMQARLFSRLFLLILLPHSGLAADWPNWRGPFFNGIADESIPDSLPDPLPVLWRQKVGTGFSTVSVAGERVLTMGNVEGTDIVSCLDAGNGEILWQKKYPCELDPLYYEGGPGGTPTIHGQSVFTLSKKGHAYCLDLDSGAVIWSRDLVKDHQLKLPEWSFACSPFIFRDKVLLNVGRGGMALARDSGDTVWLPSIETSGYATPVPFGNACLIFSAKALLSVDPETGESLASFPWKSSRDVNAADPIVLPRKRAVVSSASGTSLLDFAGDEPVEVWKQHDLKWYFNPGVLIGDHLYSIHGTTHRPTELTCTNVHTGKIVWSEENYGSGGLIATKNDIVIVFDKGILTLFRASPERFDPLVRQKILDGKCWTSPVLANGKIYCRNADGDLACVSVK